MGSDVPNPSLIKEVTMTLREKAKLGLLVIVIIYLGMHAYEIMGYLEGAYPNFSMTPPSTPTPAP
jgi:hypothetical protein